MIHEYAIDPELVVAWGKDRKDYRYFYDEFGLGTPRLMAEFPNFKNWHKRYCEAKATANANDLERKRIEELYNRITEKQICRLGLNYDGTRTWLENAEEENERHGFQAILSVNNPRDHAQVVSAAALDDLSDDHPLWHVESQVYCARTAREMADLVSPLLINCTELHFIDPYFDRLTPEKCSPLAKFFEKVAHLRTRRPPIEKIVMHTQNLKSDSTDFGKKRYEQQLPNLIPKGLQLELKRWRQRSGGEKLHHRYILTDIGGVKFDPGLDEGEAGESCEVILLGRKPYEKQWEDYVRSPAFDLDDDQPITIIGTAQIEVKK